MSQKKKLVWQLAGFILILGIGIVSMVTILNRISVSQVDGTYIKKEDAGILVSQLIKKEDNKELAAILSEFEQKEDYVTYADYEELLNIWMKESDAIENIGTDQLESLSSKYKKKHAILQEDFLEFYFQAADLLAPELEIKEEELIILAGGAKVLDQDKNPLPEGTVLAAANDLGNLRLIAYEASGSEMSRISAITSKEKVLLVFSANPVDITLKKAWVSSNLPESVSIIWKGYEVIFEKGNFSYEERQVIGDITFADGKLSEITPYNEKVTGKLLSIKDNQMEIEGYGKLSYGEDIQVYKLYGESEDYQVSDLKIGYDFADFVLDGNEIVAALVTREENMKNIRVVIKTTGFSGAYHEEITFSVDTAFTLKGEGYEKRCEPGEKITVSKDSELFTANRIVIKPDALTAKTTVYSIERGQGTPAYRGTMEIEKTDKGLLLINELLLEEYLYSVVPSEMPSSYPKEALKAQAVSARSYAYKHMLKSGLQSYGAHVDDSAAYQVYNNIAESEAALTAVRETSGKVVLFNGKVADTYFYSTSCGFGTDILAWKNSSGSEEAHLEAKNIGTKGMKLQAEGSVAETDAQAEAVAETNAQAEGSVTETDAQAEGNVAEEQNKNNTEEKKQPEEAGTSTLTAEDMKNEETFKAYIQSVGEGDFEKEEGWYRWSYKTTLNPDVLKEQLEKRYAAKPEQILTLAKDGTFVSKEIGELGQIKSITVLERSSGGAIHELLIEGTKGTYKIISEHNVRYVLANEGNQVVRKTGDTSKISGMLPSAFAIIIPEGDDSIDSYVVIGGGFGHGIGMSQNGARAMGNLGYTYEEIIKFFYEGVTLSSL